MELFIILILIVRCILLIILIFKYILIILIVIELVIMVISMLLFIRGRVVNLKIYIIYYLVFRVCERVLGLIILVLIIRFYGNENYYLINLFKFI